jgi:uncharacterized membrane protein YidH (DUF202 family)
MGEMQRSCTVQPFELNNWPHDERASQINPHVRQLGLVKLKLRLPDIPAASIHIRSVHNPERNTMKPATIIGIILILVGFVGFALGGFSFTHEKKDIDAGPIQIGHQQTKTVPIPPALSVIALVGGIALVAVGVRSK